jgi:hypothetical protein
MPVVGHGDGNRVQVPAQEELAEILVGRAALGAVFLVDGIAGPGERFVIQVADGHPLDLVLLQEGFHVARPHHAEADPGHDDAVRGGESAVLAQGRGLDDCREPRDRGPAGDRRRFQEFPSFHLFHQPSISFRLSIPDIGRQRPRLALQASGVWSENTKANRN